MGGISVCEEELVACQVAFVSELVINCALHSGIGV